MSFTQDFQPADSNEETSGAAPSPSPLGQPFEDALNEIDRILHQMLLLAELSASDGAVDRESLQTVLERLQNKIDRIADRLDSAER
ncbi:MAG: hypothetical protein K2M42_11275 [Oscillospiraceae bacterium]|nr:hypothetical protein [Oscillospiraceae bacterium]